MTSQLEANIARIEKELEEMKTRLEEEKKAKAWNPKDRSYYLSARGEVYEHATPLHLDFGTAFATRPDAEKASKYFRFIHRLYHLALELNEGWEPDWKDCHQQKHYIMYDHDLKQFTVKRCQFVPPMTPVFNTMVSANKAIEILNHEAKYW
tara:strand:+ start:2755 stop:3207 length:453 start_codon:yes stop_codon:yes gene_type:complete